MKIPETQTLGAASRIVWSSGVDTLATFPANAVFQRPTVGLLEEGL